ncbi:E3 ubiquitin-protein ligase PPP1R11 [Papilio machaon]|uniref:E3 ubiquitin-protein ligase PPP1R11 n=1 Tax=Papilio machaon TaxID=76193 RepID=UPI001E665028|nr:E3 ubiquitin-protein ligase PPP1R11 [Papilio machaon]
MGDRQRTIQAEEMATTSTAVTTVSSQIQEASVEPVTVITLRPTRSAPRKKVGWTEDTVDNEHMNKKKSKCCCIYEKPRRFDESESESSEDECENCFGHVERRHKHRAPGHAHDTTVAMATTTTTTAELQNETEPNVEVTLQPSEDPPAPPTPPAS